MHFAEAVRSHIKKRFANGPFAKFTFENIYLRGDSSGAFNLFGGEYLIVSWSPENITPETVAGLAPHARKVIGNEMGVAWNEVVTDMAWEQIVYDSKRGILIVPGRARGFDGAQLRMKAYLVPKKDGWLVFFAAGGSAEPDKVLSEVDDMLTKEVIPRERLVGKEWWAALETALGAQRTGSASPPAEEKR
jgi:hypothetical protein